MDYTQTPPRSSSSDVHSSPVTTLFSKTASSRCSSSTYNTSPVPRESWELFGSRKCSLSESRRGTSSTHHEEVDPLESRGLSSPIFQGALETDQADLYNFDDGPAQPPRELMPTAKRVRSGDSTMLPTVPSMSKRFNSFSNKWKSRTGAGPKLSIDIAASDAARSRNGSAASSVISPAIGPLSQQASCLPSPARTVFEESVKETHVSPINIEKANSPRAETDSQHATTPLLPPVLRALAAQHEMQSPLQSPTIAEGFFDLPTPLDTPRLPSTLPSPPLSTKPSVASMRQRSRAGTMVGSGNIPTADIPPVIMDADDDAWAEKLGHADFTILPEPYLPGMLDLETCKQFRQDYCQARANFKNHLAQTEENYGPTSRVFKLTEEKGAELEAEWQQYNILVSEAVEQLAREEDAMASTQSNSIATRHPRIPATDLFAGKFPMLGEQEIVGPMSVAPALKKLISHEPELRLTKKRNFFKFFSDLLARGNVRA